MNYLGHLYFSGDHYDLMMANLYGDFIKGPNYNHLPAIVQQGVTLHRQIDDFIDNHPDVLSLLNDSLYEELPKIASIAIDLYVDHLLASHWKEFHQQKLEIYVEEFFSYALKQENQSFTSNNLSFRYPDEYILLLKLMYEKSWITRYKNIEGLNMAATGLSKRISFKNNLHQAVQVFQKYEHQIKTMFYAYMKDAKTKFLP